jgi:hypothetical protein
MNHPPHVQDLTQERGLWSVFVSTLRVRRGKLSIWILVITGALLSINAFSRLAQMVRDWA